METSYGAGTDSCGSGLFYFLPAALTSLTMCQRTPRVCIIYFSLSGQSRGLVNLLAAGIRSQGGEVFIEQIVASQRIGFPFNSVFKTVLMMVLTFFRKRVNILPVSSACYGSWDLFILAGPTWSYNPSGPVLDFLDRFGKPLLRDKTAVPLISCRGFYRMHQRVLSTMLRRCGALPDPAIVFSHPVKEPWSTIGVFLKSAGFRPERLPFLARHYRHFGHNVDQLLEIRERGEQICAELRRAAD